MKKMVCLTSRVVKKCRPRHGFTLIEVVLAFSILAIILGTAYGALNQIMRAKGALDDQRDVTLIANALLSRLSRELQLAYFDERTFLLPARDQLDQKTPPNPPLIGEAKTLANGQRGDSITFLASEGGQYLPDGGTHSGIVQITYRVESDVEQIQNSEATYYLVRDETPLRPDAKEAYKRSMIFPLTGRLVSLEFSYYDAEKDRWSQEWGEQNVRQLPSIVLFSAALRSPRGRIEKYTTAVPVRIQGKRGRDF